MVVTGKKLRLARLFRHGRLLMIPFDDDLINGPYEGLLDPLGCARQVAGQVGAFLGYRRLLELCVNDGIAVPFVMNLTASTVRRDHTRKTLVGSVESALRVGCDAVAVHVNLSSAYESSMLAMLGTVSEECVQAGMPLMAIMYPRAERDGTDDNYAELKAEDRTAYARLVQHCVRVGVELGADVVKTQYTGDADSFEPVVAAAMGVPVVTAGGPKVPVDQALSDAFGAISAGAAGVCFGRNSYNRSDIAGFVRRLALVVHEGRSPGQPDPAHHVLSGSAQ